MMKFDDLCTVSIRFHWLLLDCNLDSDYIVMIIELIKGQAIPQFLQDMCPLFLTKLAICKAHEGESPWRIKLASGFLDLKSSWKRVKYICTAFDKSKTGLSLSWIWQIITASRTREMILEPSINTNRMIHMSANRKHSTFFIHNITTETNGTFSRPLFVLVAVALSNTQFRE